MAVKSELLQLYALMWIILKYNIELKKKVKNLETKLSKILPLWIYTQVVKLKCKRQDGGYH